MSVMNPINEIFVKTVQIHNTKWYQFITRLKLTKDIDSIINHLLYTQDIFTFSDEFFCIFSAPLETIDIIKDKYKSLLYINGSLLHINISKKYNIKYIPRYNEFTITDSDYGIFNIRKDTTVNGNTRKNKWIDIQKDLRQFYIKVIIDTASELAENQKG